jgi:soluble lytic murein transglycosylase
MRNLNAQILVMKKLRAAPMFLFLTLVFSLSTTACGQSLPKSEAQAIQRISEFVKNGNFPPEDLLSEVEARFPKTKTASLAKLLRAYLLMQKGEARKAADILDTEIVEQTTSLGDYALWLRGQALLQVSEFADAVKTFQKLIEKYSNSLRQADAKLLSAEISLQMSKPDDAIVFVKDLVEKNNPKALYLMAKAYRLKGDMEKTLDFLHRTRVFGVGTSEAEQAEKELKMSGESLTPKKLDYLTIRFERLLEKNRFSNVLSEYEEAKKVFVNFPDKVELRRLVALVNLRRLGEAQRVFNLITEPSVKEEAYHHLARGYLAARQWAQARSLIEQMRRAYPKSAWTLKTLVDASSTANKAKNKTEESYYFRLVLSDYPNSKEAVQAHFGLAWFEHESRNFSKSAQMLAEHLAVYVERDNSYRGKAGYWAARDFEQIGKFKEACFLYDALIYRYNANWYGYLAVQRLSALKEQGQCQNADFPKDSLIRKAASNLKTIVVESETATELEEERLTKAEQLNLIGLTDWAFEELQKASETAPRSPKVNLALAKQFRMKNENFRAIITLARSYPDYAQMFPEEMTTEEWSVFYPLNYWELIKLWAARRNLDAYLVAGLIRQESAFNPRAKSTANAYGLMQLLIPTARQMARKYSISTEVTEESLYDPALNIELGTAYMREMFDKFGRIEYAAAAYNAGPGRIPQWRSALPSQIDEFVEAIPFAETRGYVQGVVRNTAQYRRLYDEQGNFRPNVGTKPVKISPSGTRRRIAQDFPEVIVSDSVE